AGEPPASATPSPVTGTTTSLHVLGADDGGASSLTYAWASSGPAGVTFSANGTNAARDVTATFSRAGTYTFVVTITDAGGLSVTSTVTVPVAQTVAASRVTPGTATVVVRQQQQFTATAYDQFGSKLTTQPVFTWSLTGRGSLTRKGLYTAPRRGGGPYTITASFGGIKGTALVTVIK